jgi:hypothetical protein
MRRRAPGVDESASGRCLVAFATPRRRERNRQHQFKMWRRSSVSADTMRDCADEFFAVNFFARLAKILRAKTARRIFENA